MSMKNLLLGLLLVAVFVAGFVVGRFNFAVSTSTLSGNQSSSKEVPGTITGATTQDSTTEAITENLTDDQKKVLSALGVDVEKITPAMVACAETSLGASRVEEIKGGSAVTFTEKVKLLACYK